MEVVELKRNPIISELLAELRDIDRQKDRYMFRRNVRTLGQYIAYEMSNSYDKKGISVRSVLDVAPHGVLKEQPSLVSILRAANPMTNGCLEVFRRADTSYLAASREKAGVDDDGKTLYDYIIAYDSLTDVKGKDVIISDPMLATGGTTSKVCSIVKEHDPRSVKVQCLFTVPEGLTLMEKNHPDIDIYTGVIDTHLNDLKYIVPGLGDAGDLMYGRKLERL